MASPIVTTVLLIRHGERSAPTPTTPDPPLTAAGQARVRRGKQEHFVIQAVLRVR